MDLKPPKALGCVGHGSGRDSDRKPPKVPGVDRSPRAERIKRDKDLDLRLLCIYSVLGKKFSPLFFFLFINDPLVINGGECVVICTTCYVLLTCRSHAGWT